jgi:hypothetical protein
MQEAWDARSLLAGTLFFSHAPHALLCVNEGRRGITLNRSRTVRSPGGGMAARALPKS